MTTADFYYNELWNKTLQAIHDTGKIESESFEYYFKNSKLVELQDTGAVVLVPLFIHYSLMMQHKDLIEACFQEQVGGTYIPITVVREEDYNPISKQVFDVPSIFDRSIDKNQNFSNFVLGKSNIQAQLASLTCANNPGLVYNPLFIYGNSGLGKTHLLNSIGNQVFKQFGGNKKIGFISGLGFIEALDKAKKTDTISAFKESFYDLDLLLVDDIQFIAGKSWTQEVFFSIFSNLVNNKRQVCITADRTPGEIKGLEERIISRFIQGLNVNIDSPEYETSIKILKLKLEMQSSDKVDEEVLSYMATNFSQDVRSLEGAVNRLLFYYINFNFSNEDHISLKLATEAFKDQIIDTKNELSISKVRKVVCDYYGLSSQQIKSATRTKNIAIPRHIAMYLCRKLLDAPYKEIGNEFGKRDHSTVINACEKVEELIKKDPLFLKAIKDIESKLD